MKTVNLVIAITVTLLMLNGCASSRSGSVYTRDEARQVQEVEFGTVEHVREIQIEGTSGMVGTAAGAAIGGIAGSSVGGGKGSLIAAVAGAVIGGLAGAAAEEGTTRKPGFELTVKLEKSGRMISVVQEAREGEAFSVGSRVRVLTSGYETRVAN